MMKSLVLCADDYGLCAEVDTGIRELVVTGRLSAVSCMTSLPNWPEAVQLLLALNAPVALGLHFNLTEFGDGQPLVRLMQQALSRRIDRQWVGDQFQRQLDAFEAASGRVPDFIDGHQHVHVFDGVREVIASVLAARYGTASPWVRRVNPSLNGHDAVLKAIVLRLLARGADACYAAASIPQSRTFAGLYSLSMKADFPALMAGWLRDLEAGAVIMCHPGQMQSTTPLAQVRRREYDWLRSEAFSALLQQQQISLSQVPAFLTT